MCLVTLAYAAHCPGRRRQVWWWRGVDALLQQRPERGRQQAERGDRHGGVSDITMPASALCTAIRRARRAISIASASRSSRSVVSTTSAASEEAVAPRAPIATRTVAAASAGASLRPSPTITVTARCASARTPATLLAGVLLSAHLVQPQDRPTSRAGSGRFGPVPGEHHQPPTHDIDTGSG